MVKLFISTLWIFSNLLIMNFAYSNEVTFHQIEIKHPSYDGIKPLEITTTIRFHHGYEQITKQYYWPMRFYITMVSDTEEHQIELDGAWWEYYDAYPTFDKTGYILIRKREYPEYSYLSEIEIVKNGTIRIDNPKGEDVFWSKDGKYLITATLPSGFNNGEYTLYFYDMKKIKYVINKGGILERVEEIKYNETDEIMKYVTENLIRVENNEDIKWVIIDKEGKK